MLLSWCRHDSAAAKPFVEKLLADEMEILRRVGIYVLGQQWAALRDLYSKLLSPKLFNSGISMSFITFSVHISLI